MNPFITSNRCFAPLFTDATTADAFATQATLDHFKAFEIALTHAAGKVGLIPPKDAQDAVAAMQDFVPDMAGLAQDILTDGLPVPGYVRQLKAHVGEAHVAAVHIGTTSQDLIDTAQSLTLAQVNPRLLDGLGRVLAALDLLMTAHGDTPMMARTRMQAALPATVGNRIGNWIAPLRDHCARGQALRPLVERMQLGGPVGDRLGFDGKGAAVSALMAAELGLHDAPVWHVTRHHLADYAGWLAQITGSLGKMGQDIALMAQQGVDAVVLDGGGSSSAMPHKQNPVLAETLVTFARYNAVQLSGMHQAMVHEQERSGTAWPLEWMILPAMVMTTMQAVTLAERCLGQITQMGQPA